MRTIAVANQKGGCGKTTTAVNLAAALAMSGVRVLIIDLDPQGHTTLGLGYDPSKLGRTVYNAIVDKTLSLSDVMLDSKLHSLKVVPSNIMLGMAELDLRTHVAKEHILMEKLHTIQDRFDFCIIDCAPPLSLLMINALVASEDVIITVQTHYYALEGLKRLLETIHIIHKRFHPCEVRALGILLTFVESRTLLCQQVEEQLRAHFGSLVFDTVIHRNIRLAEAPSAGESIMTYAPANKGAKEYMALAREVEHRVSVVGVA
jgi:chromosome partitioning protein